MCVPNELQNYFEYKTFKGTSCVFTSVPESQITIRSTANHFEVMDQNSKKQTRPGLIVVLLQYNPKARAYYCATVRHNPIGDLSLTLPNTLHRQSLFRNHALP